MPVSAYLVDSFGGQFACGPPMLSYGVLSGPERGQGRAGQGVLCCINANKVSGVGCDNAVDGDEAGGKDKVAVVKVLRLHSNAKGQQMWMIQRAKHLRPDRGEPGNGRQSTHRSRARWPAASPLMHCTALH